MMSNAADTLVSLSRSPELSLLVKATVVMGAGLAAAGLARRARASVRHVVLAATLASLLALPLAAATELAIAIEVPAASSAPPAAPPAVASAPREAGRMAAPAADAESRAPFDRAVTWPAVVRAVWLAGAAMLLAQLALTLWRLRRLRRTGLPWPEMRAAIHSLAADAGVDRSVELALHEDVASPLTFGTRHPLIVLPPDARGWSEANLRRALVHELEHVRRCDWALQTAARAVCAAWWFHPLVWVAWRRLSLEAERACDDAVVVKEEGMDYADQLVSLAERLSAARALPTLGMANRSDLSARVSALLDDRQRRGRPGAAAIAAAAAAALLLVLTVAPLRAVARHYDEPADTVASARADVPASDQDRAARALGRALYEAASEADLPGMRELIAAGADVNAAIVGDGSPLIGAARSGDSRAVALLLDSGADPNLGVPGDGSALIAAAASGHVDLLTLLLDRGARVDMVVTGDENALIAASAAGRLAAVKVLVARGADVNARVNSGFLFTVGEEWRTPLSMARRGGHADVVAFLLANGAR